MLPKAWMPDLVRHDNSGASAKFVIAGPDPQSMLQKAWMPDQVRHDNSQVCHCGLDPQSILPKAWMPDQVRHDNSQVCHCGPRPAIHAAEGVDAGSGPA